MSVNPRNLVARRTRTRTSTTQILWDDDHVRALLAERQRRNDDYWYAYPGRSRTQFWREIANYVNRTCGTRYTGIQCSRKFTSLISEYNVSKLIIKKYTNIPIIYILIVLIL
jgi:Myb/SANT-like DNA-binding domain